MTPTAISQLNAENVTPNEDSGCGLKRDRPPAGPFPGKSPCVNSQGDHPPVAARAMDQLNKEIDRLRDRFREINITRWQRTDEGAIGNSPHIGWPMPYRFLSPEREIELHHIAEALTGLYRTRSVLHAQEMIQKFC